MMIFRISWFLIKVTDTALLGHVGTDVLAASAIADLWMSSTGVFTMGGILSTFVGNAVGAGNKKMGGVWLQVSLIVVGSVTIPVMILWFLTEPVTRGFGVEGSMAADAGFFATILALCLPARTAFGQATQFFSAQKIIRPNAYVTGFGATFNLVSGLILVLGIPIQNWDGFGFPACPWTTVATEHLQLLLLWYYACHLKGLHEECWGGWKWAEITKERLIEYCRMFFPAVLSAASDWWRVSAIGVIATTLGTLDLAVFNTSYRVTWGTLTIIGSLGGALRVKLGIFLGAGDVQEAKRVVFLALVLAIGTLLLLCVLISGFIDGLANVFTDDPEVIRKFVNVRWPLCFMIFFMNLSVFLEQILLAMGRTKTVFYAGVIGSWVGQVPGVVMALYLWRKDLVGLYWGVTFGYMMLDVLLYFLIHRITWADVVAEAQARGGSKAAK
mmetsp:Transcript_53327/g.126066  ORF Transcript_53327/g.126066 Transcript_53327/m.126066 type:complete len:442 (+) Transcript_53327:30-1355(+)